MLHRKIKQNRIKSKGRPWKTKVFKTYERHFCQGFLEAFKRRSEGFQKRLSKAFQRAFKRPFQSLLKALEDFPKFLSKAFQRYLKKSLKGLLKVFTRPLLLPFILALPLVKRAQGPGIGATGADAGGVWGGAEPPPPSKSYYGHPKGPGAQGP